MSLDLSAIRAEFPSLAVSDNNRPRIYLDNPGGTQVSRRVIERMTQYLTHSNANHGGWFATSKESDALLEEAHKAVAELFNAPSPQEIVFGANMTTLTFSISRSLAHWFKPGDEILLTHMDHDANVSPWLQMAAERELNVKWLDFSPSTYQYDLEALSELLSERTKLVAVNYASNAIGTINDVKTITQMAHAVGALVYVDAVHYVPHGSVDVQTLGCDFLACSPYKFFGPHQGALWGKAELLEKLPAYKVRPASSELPSKFETGTQNHEAQAGTLGAVEHFAWIGETMGQDYQSQYTHFSGRQRYIHAGLAAIKDYEQKLSWYLVKGLQAIEGVKIHGITEPMQMTNRVPTVSFTHQGYHPAEIAQALAAETIFVWDGHYYAIEVIKRLGLEESGGMVRVGAVHYNTTAEIDRMLDVLASMKAGGRRH